jgi:signal transduction histidine kinase
MSAFFSQVFALLTSPPGNLVYELVLVFSIAGALQSALIQLRAGDSVRSRRVLLGLVVLLATQVILFTLGSLSWRGVVDPARILPPLDRATALISIIWIAWLWAFPDPSPRADAGAVLLSLMAAAAAALALLTSGSQPPSFGYNQTTQDLLWQSASILLVALGAVVLVIRRPVGFANGLALLSLLFIGHLAHALAKEVGNYSGILRLAYVAAFPILLTLPQRLPGLEGTAEPSGEAPRAPTAGAKRYAADPKTIHALFALAAESSPPKANQAITRAVSHTMLADLCFLVTLSDDQNDMAIACGYDLIREEYLPGTSLNKAAIPRLTNAIQRGRPLRLAASGTSADITGLAEILGLSNPGNLLSAPIVTAEKESLGGVILLSPYSQRQWTAEDQTFLQSIAGSLAHVLGREKKVAELEQRSGDLKEALEIADTRITNSERQTDEVTKQLQALTLRAGQEGSQTEELESLRAAQEHSERVIADLQRELDVERNQRGPAGAQLEDAVNASLRDVAHLQNQLAESNQKILDIEHGAGGERRKREQTEIIASISQELRQPMSSIIGYTDLLLGESVGILGALQRKFIERIKASTERIGSLIEDMIQLNTLEVGLSDLKPEAMDLNLIIDNALAYTGSQVREKKISMHLDVPKKVAPVNADREALQQILIHLLQNAGAATPVEGTIDLKVQTTHDEGKAFVMIQVTDSGGGIPQEDLPRVFTRLYRADNVLIQGVGDTGVGLSIAKTLTEAQHGRIWVESKPGAGATFNVLLPAVRESVDSVPRKETN